MGSIRRECLDHILILSEEHLRRVLKEYAAYFNRSRPHQGIQQYVSQGSNVGYRGPCAATPLARSCCGILLRHPNPSFLNRQRPRGRQERPRSGLRQRHPNVIPLPQVTAEHP